MKKMMMLILMLVFTVSVAFAVNFTEVEYTVGCNDFKTVVGNLMVDYGEVMIFEGQEENEVFTALYANAKTGTWSVIKYTEARTAACVLSDGTGYDIP